MSQSSLKDDLEKGDKPSLSDLNSLQAIIDFKMDKGLLDFLTTYNGAQGSLNDSFILIWSIPDIVALNPYYDDETDDGYSNQLFLFGSNGSDTGYGIVKETGIFIAVPFVGMSREETEILGSTFEEFLNKVANFSS